MIVGARKAGTSTANTVSKVCGGFNRTQDTLSIHFLCERQFVFFLECGRCWVALAITLHSMTDNTIQLWGTSANLGTHKASHLLLVRGVRADKRTDTFPVCSKPQIISGLHLEERACASQRWKETEVCMVSLNWDTTVQSLPWNVAAVIGHKGGLKWCDLY